MQILLASAKIMNDSCEVKPVSHPRFEADAQRFALELHGWTAQELAEGYHSSLSIAAENVLRFGRFACEEDLLPAVLAYQGQAYRHLRAGEMSGEDLRWAQDHLWITSFLYGLLRPLDAIHPYRLEGKMSLEATGGQTMFAYWRSRLTDVLIDAVRADDGVLMHLATAEMEHLFDWCRVKREVRVVQPLFYADQGHRLKAISVHAKSCRGAMVRKIITERVHDVDQILDFEWEGYRHAPSYGEPDVPHFIWKEGL